MSERVTLGNHVELMTGFPFKSANYTQNGLDVRLVRGDNVVQGALRWDNAARWIRATKVFERATKQLVIPESF